MKARTINAVICKKFNEWVDSIKDRALRERVEKNTIATGGCIASMLLGEPVKDFDFYFRNRETALAVAWHYVNALNAARRLASAGCSTKPVEVTVNEAGGAVKIVVQSDGVAAESADGVSRYLESEAGSPDADLLAEAPKEAKPDGKERFRPVFLSANAVTLSDGVQLVLRFWGEPAEIHQSYDFVHCTNFWTSWQWSVTLNPAALESLLTKELRYVGSKFPLCSVIRVRKFVARGWTITAGQLLKICMQVQQLDLTKVSVLEDQLTGVDVAYFVNVLERLKEKDPERIDSAYLMEIIDRMF